MREGNEERRERERERTIARNIEVLQKDRGNGDAIKMFTIMQLNKALDKSGRTTPGKDQIRY